MAYSHLSRELATLWNTWNSGDPTTSGVSQGGQGGVDILVLRLQVDRRCSHLEVLWEGEGITLAGENVQHLLECRIGTLVRPL